MGNTAQLSKSTNSTTISSDSSVQYQASLISPEVTAETKVVASAPEPEYAISATERFMGERPDDADLDSIHAQKLRLLEKLMAHLPAPPGQMLQATVAGFPRQLEYDEIVSGSVAKLADLLVVEPPRLLLGGEEVTGRTETIKTETMLELIHTLDEQNSKPRVKMRSEIAHERHKPLEEINEALLNDKLIINIVKQMLTIQELELTPHEFVNWLNNNGHIWGQETDWGVTALKEWLGENSVRQRQFDLVLNNFHIPAPTMNEVIAKSGIAPPLDYPSYALQVAESLRTQVEGFPDKITSDLVQKAIERELERVKQSLSLGQAEPLNLVETDIKEYSDKVSSGSGSPPGGNNNNRRKGEPEPDGERQPEFLHNWIERGRPFELDPSLLRYLDSEEGRNLLQHPEVLQDFIEYYKKLLDQILEKEGSSGIWRWLFVESRNGWLTASGIYGLQEWLKDPENRQQFAKGMQYKVSGAAFDLEEISSLAQEGRFTEALEIAEDLTIVLRSEAFVTPIRHLLTLTEYKLEQLKALQVQDKTDNNEVPQ